MTLKSHFGIKKKSELCIMHDGEGQVVGVDCAGHLPMEGFLLVSIDPDHLQHLLSHGLGPFHGPEPFSLQGITAGSMPLHPAAMRASLHTQTLPGHLSLRKQCHTGFWCLPMVQSLGKRGACGQVIPNYNEICYFKEEKPKITKIEYQKYQFFS